MKAITIEKHLETNSIRHNRKIALQLVKVKNWKVRMLRGKDYKVESTDD